ncbi:MAG TPA: alpha/beta fold hydrolase [Chloroflexia bacterium]|nr:alpha/beta fold hydrolase [Chloroflexia bacterium]
MQRHLPALRTTRTVTRGRVLLIGLLAFLGFNGVAWMQAWTLTHYVEAGPPAPHIEALSLAQRVSAVLFGVRVPRPRNLHTPADVGLDYETHRIPVEDGGSLEGWYVPHAGARAIVLLFAGYASSKESLVSPAAALHDLGYAAFLVDFRGTGGSTGADTALGAREAVDVAHAATYAAQTWPGRPLVLYGISMGAAAVLRAIAVEGVHPAAIILESPFDRLIDTVDNRFDAMGLPSFPAAPAIVFWGSVQHGMNGFTHNPVDYARAVTCPTLLLHGERDPRVTPAQNAAVYAALPEPKRLVTFPGAGHDLLILADAAAWRAALAPFLAAVGR